MRIIVLSDSHGDYFSLRTAVMCQPTADAVLFCGDGEEDIDRIKMEFPDKMVVAVRGNNDWGSDKKYSETLTLCGKKIFMTHGHLHHVKYDYQELINYAHSIGADILLFGHTHTSYTSYDDGMYIMNPGASGYYYATYGIVDITPAGIVTNIVSIPNR